MAVRITLLFPVAEAVMNGFSLLHFPYERQEQLYIVSPETGHGDKTKSLPTCSIINLLHAGRGSRLRMRRITVMNIE
jgi:hypothetical protein